jgi:glycosyltransferase involved in cell wall biosynthesis
VIHVAFLSTYPERCAPAVGGVQAASVRLVTALASNGVRVTVIGAGLSAPYEKDGVRALAAPLDDRRALVTGFKRWRRSALRLIAEVAPDVVHGQGLIPGGIAAVQAERHPRIVTAQGNVLRDTLAAYHGAGKWPRALIGRRLARVAARRADVAIAAHPDWRWNMPCEPRSFVHIPTIVEDAFYRGRRRPIPGRVLFCGGGRYIKGFDVLARAWPTIVRAIPGATLVAVGWSEAEMHSVPQLDACETHGWLTPRELAREMETSALIAIPSRFDVAPLALAEAWAARLPVVATSVGGLGRLAEGAALLVPADAPSQLADAIIETLRGDSDMSAYIDEGADRATAWSARAVVEAHINVYSEALR